MPEDQKRSPLLTIILVALVGAGAAAWYLYFTADEQLLVDQSDEIASPISAGLDADPTEEPFLAGMLYFTSPSAFYPVNELSSFSRQLVLNAGAADLVAAVPMRDFNAIDATKGIALAAKDDVGGSQAWQPVVYDRTTETVEAVQNISGYWVNDLQLAPDQAHYAYNYVTEEMPSPNLRTISDWHIAVSSLDGETVLDIPAAAEPTWINGGADLLYLSREGIFRYNVASGESTLVFNDYVPFDYFDDMAASPDSSTVVLTIPFIRERTMVVVFGVEADGALTEMSRLVSEDTKRRSPVFSPDGQYYAVMAAKETRVNGEPNLPETEKVIEIRDLSHEQPVATIVVPEETAEPIELEAWTL